MKPWHERLKAFMEAISSGATLKVTRDSDSWIRPAEAALVEAEAESEVHEPAGNGFNKEAVCKLFDVPPSIVGIETKVAPHCTLPQAEEMTWRGWAVPAILEVLAEPHGIYSNLADWQDHIAPLIADRIACDPQRAIEALSRMVTP